MCEHTLGTSASLLSRSMVPWHRPDTLGKSQHATCEYATYVNMRWGLQPQFLAGARCLGIDLTPSQFAEEAFARIHALRR